MNIGQLVSDQSVGRMVSRDSNTTRLWTHSESPLLVLLSYGTAKHQTKYDFGIVTCNQTDLFVWKPFALNSVHI